MHLPMASRNDTRVYRLCRALVPSKRAVSLFTTTGIQQQWSRRIESLLCVPAESSDGLPGYICEKCKVRILSLEKAALDLEEFKETARCSRSALARPLKRPKSTSSQFGVSPDTARQRPRSKISRKRLDFESKFSKHNKFGKKCKYQCLSFLDRSQQECCFSASTSH